MRLFPMWKLWLLRSGLRLKQPFTFLCIVPISFVWPPVSTRASCYAAWFFGAKVGVKWKLVLKIVLVWFPQSRKWHSKMFGTVLMFYDRDCKLSLPWKLPSKNLLLLYATPTRSNTGSFLWFESVSSSTPEPLSSFLKEAELSFYFQISSSTRLLCLKPRSI